jgi:cob(I)alamin adenosyltransferase
MAKRLTKIVTRTGDSGTTGLADGSRLPKDALRIETMGTVDELNSSIGVLLAEDLPQEVRACLTNVQHDLTETHAARLEALLEGFNAALPALREFVLPGGSRAASLAHVARTVCRRAERRLVALSQQESIAPALLHYLNRLSDLLFVLARALNRHAGLGDVLWQQGKNR